MILPTVVEAVAALNAAAGHLRELDRPDVADRCVAASDRLQIACSALESGEFDEELGEAGA